MKFFLDTANLEQIRAAAALGVLDGGRQTHSLWRKRGLRAEVRLCAITLRFAALWVAM